MSQSASKRESKHSAKGRSSLTARETLLKAGKKLFARKGLSGTTIRDIAQEAGLNSSMISYYFSGKEGLYIECFKEIGETRLRFASDILQPPKNIEDYLTRLTLFIENLFTLFSEDRNSGLMIIREYDRIHSPAEKVFSENFLKLFDLLNDFFKSAQKLGLIPKDKDPLILAFLFFGSITSQLRLDHIKERAYKRSLKDTKEKDKTFTQILELFSFKPSI